jgi:hypothetical protein
MLELDEFVCIFSCANLLLGRGATVPVFFVFVNIWQSLYLDYAACIKWLFDLAFVAAGEVDKHRVSMGLRSSSLSRNFLFQTHFFCHRSHFARGHKRPPRESCIRT